MSFVTRICSYQGCSTQDFLEINLGKAKIAEKLILILFRMKFVETDQCIQQSEVYIFLFLVIRS